MSYKIKNIAMFAPVLVMLAGSTFAQTVVISGDGNWVAGDVISEGKVIAPAAGETVRIIVGDEIAPVSAPQRFIVEASSRKEDIWSIAVAINATRVLAEERRWLRNGIVPTVPPTLWSVDFTSSGTYCFTLTEQLRLWRTNPEAEIEIQISDVEGRWDVFVELLAGEVSLPWPRFPSGLSGDFMLSPNRGTQALIKTREISADTPLDTILSLATNGCDYQLFLITKGLVLENADGG